MSNYAICPNPECNAEIDATAAAKARECPECETAFSVLVRLTEPKNDPADAGPHHEVQVCTSRIFPTTA